jgi:glycosyltransferase involved in cell wall biosynthesis
MGGPVRVVVDGFSHRFGGGITYLRELLPRLVAQPDIAGVRLIIEPGSRLERSLSGGPVDIVRVRTRLRGLPGRLAWEAVMLPAVAEGAVVISPNSMLPRAIGAPVIAVPHNILPFVQRDTRTVLQRAAIIRTIRFSAGVIFVSEAMRAQVAREVRVPSDSPVIHHGVASPFRSEPPGSEGRAGILCVSDHYPHKRLELLIAAWELLPEPRPALRVIGTPLHPVDHPDVAFDAEVDAEGIARALRAAALVVLPSEAESFGLPALEALACGARLLASDIPAFREVTGGHARLVSGSDPRAWAAEIVDALRQPLSAAPRIWALTFTWERTAAQTAALIRRVADLNHTGDISLRSRSS